MRETDQPLVGVGTKIGHGPDIIKQIGLCFSLFGSMPLPFVLFSHHDKAQSKFICCLLG